MNTNAEEENTNSLIIHISLQRTGICLLAEIFTQYHFILCNLFFEALVYSISHRLLYTGGHCLNPFTAF